jgi:hypothetical protein
VKVSIKLRDYLIQALTESFNIERMQNLVTRVLPDYDLRRASGFPPNIPIPQQDAAALIGAEIIRAGELRRFTEVLIDVGRNGIMGRAVSIRLLPKIVAEIEKQGLIFKEEYGLFMESVPGLRTKNWGVLREGQAYEISFLRMDIADSSSLVRKYSKPAVFKAYADLRSLFGGIVERREGRVWRWEGDAGIAAFCFGAKNVQATLAGMEILLELFMYSLYHHPFDGNLHLRLAVHTGPCTFLDTFEEIRSDTLKHLELIESQFTAADSLTISPGVYSDMGTKLESFFRPVQTDKGHALYQYQLGWE